MDKENKNPITGGRDTEFGWEKQWYCEKRGAFFSDADAKVPCANCEECRAASVL